MRAVLVRDCEVQNPEFYERKKAGLDTTGIKCGQPGKAGQVIASKWAWKLVRLGMAVPGDDECKQRVRMTDEDIEKAIEAARRLDESIGFDFEKGKLIFENDPEVVGKDASEKDELLYILGSKKNPGPGGNPPNNPPTVP